MATQTYHAGFNFGGHPLRLVSCEGDTHLNRCLKLFDLGVPVKHHPELCLLSTEVKRLGFAVEAETEACIEADGRSFPLRTQTTNFSQTGMFWETAFINPSANTLTVVVAQQIETHTKRKLS